MLIEIVRKTAYVWRSPKRLSVYETTVKMYESENKFSSMPLSDPGVAIMKVEAPTPLPALLKKKILNSLTKKKTAFFENFVLFLSHFFLYLNFSYR